LKKGIFCEFFWKKLSRYLFDSFYIIFIIFLSIIKNFFMSICQRGIYTNIQKGKRASTIRQKEPLSQGHDVKTKELQITVVI